MKKNLFVCALLIVLLLIFSPTLEALDLAVYSDFTASTSSLPLWLHANEWGSYIPEESFQALLGLRMNQSGYLSDSVRYSLSTDVSGNLSNKAVFLPKEISGSLFWRSFLLQAGITKRTVGELPFPDLSSGSLSISGNAVPIPQITLSLPEYVGIPLLGDKFLIKGGISHGILLDERYTARPLYHEKWLYGKIDQGPQFSFYGGLVHQAFWGGEDDNGNALPVTWENYLRVFFNTSGGDDASSSDQLNRAGDSRGIWDFGIKLGFNYFDLYLYKQHFFEDGSGFYKMQNMADGLWGVALSPTEDGIVKAVNLELISTTYQSGPFHDVTVDSQRIILGGRDSYYSHSVYKSGWTYWGRIIGTPYFLVSGEGEDSRIASNRIFGIAASTSIKISGKHFLLFRADWVRHLTPYTQPDAVSFVSVDQGKIDVVHSFLSWEIEDCFNITGLEATSALSFDIEFGADTVFRFGTRVGMVYTL